MMSIAGTSHQSRVSRKRKILSAFVRARANEISARKVTIAHESFRQEFKDERSFKLRTALIRRGFSPPAINMALGLSGTTKTPQTSLCSGHVDLSRSNHQFFRFGRAEKLPTSRVLQTADSDVGAQDVPPLNLKFI
jgi:hypothetical protein